VLGGAVFYLMEAVEGINPGAVDHVAAGLADVGRPDGFLERQVPRWRAQLRSYGDVPGYPGPGLPHVEEVARWLEAHRPATFRPGLVHGDYHLNNVLLATARPRVAAVVDWEMCTVGDPLLDLGWLLVTWPVDADELPAGPVAGGPLAEAGGLPTPAELVEAYARHSERDLSAVAWYTVLAGFKLGIVLEGTHARAHTGQADRDTGERLHRAAVGLLARSARIAGVG
jgi:aminoglycoside phosphotransferase (APT) family kinase protein